MSKLKVSLQFYVCNFFSNAFNFIKIIHITTLLNNSIKKNLGKKDKTRRFFGEPAQVEFVIYHKCFVFSSHCRCYQYLNVIYFFVVPTPS